MRAVASAVLLAVLATGCAGPSGGGNPRGHGHRGRGGDSDSQRDEFSRSSPDPVYMMTEELHIDLKLTAAQEPLWQSLMRQIDAMRGDAARERARLQHPHPETAPQGIDHSVDLAQDRLAAAEDAAAAARVLYASLNNEQKKVADTRLARLLQVQ
ncbi:MAG: Spy/CpxP family protein refolding chaperone [Burkholderiales bacterium]